MLHSYGRLGSGELLRTYGFSEAQGSRHSTITLTRRAVVEAAAAQVVRAGGEELSLEEGARRMEALARAGHAPAVFSLARAQPIPPSLLTTLQVLLCLSVKLPSRRP